MFGGRRFRAPASYVDSAVRIRRANAHLAVRAEPIHGARPHAVLESRRIDAEIGTEVPVPRGNECIDTLHASVIGISDGRLQARWF